MTQYLKYLTRCATAACAALTLLSAAIAQPDDFEPVTDAIQNSGKLQVNHVLSDFERADAVINTKRFSGIDGDGLDGALCPPRPERKAHVRPLPRKST